MYVITPFSYDRVRGEAECEIIRKRYNNKLLYHRRVHDKFPEKFTDWNYFIQGKQTFQAR